MRDWSVIYQLSAFSFLGKEKLGLKCRSEDIIVQLEDETIIDDDDYLECLDQNTVLLLSGKFPINKVHFRRW